MCGRKFSANREGRAAHKLVEHALSEHSEEERKAFVKSKQTLTKELHNEANPNTTTRLPEVDTLRKDEA
jgi:hypothetical protein